MDEDDALAFGDGFVIVVAVNNPRDVDDDRTGRDSDVVDVVRSDEAIALAPGIRLNDCMVVFRVQ